MINQTNDYSSSKKQDTSAKNTNKSKNNTDSSLSLTGKPTVQIRSALQTAKTGIKNQLGKLTDRPTLRWIFQCFQGIHLVVFSGMKQIANLSDERQFTFKFFPLSCRKYYILSG